MNKTFAQTAESGEPEVQHLQPAEVGDPFSRTCPLPRYRREPLRAGSMHLTVRDLAVLHDLYRYHFLVTSQLATLRAHDPAQKRRFISRLTLTRRLKLLFHHHYVRRIARPLPQGSREPVYGLDTAGARALSATGEDAKAPPRSRLPGHVALDHLLGIAQLRVCLETACSVVRESPVAGYSDYRLEQWLAGEQCRFKLPLEAPGVRRQTVSIIPDGGAVIRNGRTRHYSFIEVDLGTEPQPVIVGKARAYAAYWQTGGFARDFAVPRGLGFRVLFVAPTSKRVQAIVNAVQTVSGPRELFRIAQAIDITPERILTSIWVDGAGGGQTDPFLL